MNTLERLQVQDTDNKPVSSGLGQLNQLFHREYKAWQDKAKQTITEGDIPLLIRLDDRLVLVEGARETVYQINTERYHEFKALSHLPLLAYLLLDKTPPARTDLLAVLEQLAELQTASPGLGEHLNFIRSTFAALLEKVSADQGVLAYSAALNFSNAFKPLFQKLLSEAAIEEVDQLMAALLKIRSTVDKEKWSKAYFIICAGHQPRYKQITKLFFARWLKEETHSSIEAIHRVIYAESCTNQAEVVDLVTSRMVSERLSSLFLHSPLSLDEDVLGDAAIAAINLKFAQQQI